MLQYLRAIKVPLILVAMSTLASILIHDQLNETLGVVLSNVVRVLLALVCGWLVISRKAGGLWAAAFAGALVFFVDHVLVKGSSFLLKGEFQAFIGVLISYAMLFWVAMAISLLGGYAAKLWVGGRIQRGT